MEIKDFKFRTAHGIIIDDIIQYIKSYMELHSDEYIRIAVGSDSQVIGSNTTYATAIMLRRESLYGDIGFGSHIIYFKYKKPVRRDFYTKMWEEIQATTELGSYLKDKLNRNDIEVHYDFNKKGQYKSSKFTSHAIGYALSNGFLEDNIKVKPSAIAAQNIADRLCKGNLSV